MKKKFIFLFIAILSIVLLTACGDKETTLEGTGYGITYKDNVGVATMKVVDGVVDTVKLEEVFLPNTWAEVDKGDLTEAPDNVIVVGEKWYAKYIIIGDKQFTGTLREETLVINEVEYPKQNIKYTADNIDDLYIWLTQSEENCKWYATEVLDGNASIANSDFTPSAYEFAGKNGFTKSETGYWPASEERLGWKANMAAIETALKGTAMDSADKIEKNEDGYWKINEAVTGATLGNFKDYYEVARRAFINANAQNNND